MKTAIFTPYGTSSHESGLIYLLANYLRPACSELIQLRCNGVFSACDRDREAPRSLHSCALCSADQGTLAAWSEAVVGNLSRYLTPEDVLESKRWAFLYPAEQLGSAAYDGEGIYKLCRDSLVERFGDGAVEPETARSYALSALRMKLASRRFLGSVLPDILLVADGRGILSRALLSESAPADRTAVVFQWNAGMRAIQISKSDSDQMLSCDLLVKDVSKMRANPKTWPQELIAILQGIAEFVGISDSQIPLPLAR